jgi:hypothetical protein
MIATFIIPPKSRQLLDLSYHTIAASACMQLGSIKSCDTGRPMAWVELDDECWALFFAGVELLTLALETSRIHDGVIPSSPRA